MDNYYKIVSINCSDYNLVNVAYIGWKGRRIINFIELWFIEGLEGLKI